VKEHLNEAIQDLLPACARIVPTLPPSVAYDWRRTVWSMIAGASSSIFLAVR
jgi:hypothetical protein